MKKRITTILFFQLLLLQYLSAQVTNTDYMRSTGKIYVVVAVILAIFIGIILFLVYLDKKLTKLENQIKD